MFEFAILATVAFGLLYNVNMLLIAAKGSIQYHHCPVTKES
jgi:hypothetical protein